jgi:CubicO group peptidase (beta-lactamase class C family)
VDRWLPELADRRVLERPDAPLDQTVPAKRPITVRDLLTSTNGGGASFVETPLSAAIHAAGVGPGPISPQMTADEFMHRIGELPLAYQPGERWTYHTSTDLLSVLLLRAGDAPLRETLSTRIFKPLGMKNTGFLANPEDLPTAYRPTSTGLEVFDAPDGAFSRSPAFETLSTGLVSTAADCLRFLAALADDQLLTPGLRVQMTTDQLTPAQRAGIVEQEGPAISWGWQIGVQTEPADPWLHVGRFGWMGGTGTSGAVDPSRDLIGVVLTQRLLSGPGESFGYFWEPVVAVIDSHR